MSADTTAMSLINNEWSDGVVFCRGPPVIGSLGDVFLDPDLQRTVVGSELDATNEGSMAAEQWGAGVPQGTTLAMGLRRGETRTLYIRGSGTWPSGACWF